MLQTFAVFLLFLFPLIFFHELGHFIFAKLFGVRVETFSIGFGPKILKWKKGETEYALSLIPFGGYVKMFGESILAKDEIAEDERNKSFIHKNKWQRFWIVFAGPLFNIIFAFVLYFILAVGGERVPEVKFGIVTPDNILHQSGVRTADVIKKINQREIETPTDIDLDESSVVTSIEVARSGERIKLSLNIAGMAFMEAFHQADPLFRMPVVVDQNGKKWILSTNDSKVDWYRSFEEMVLSDIKQVYLFEVLDIDLQKADLSKKQLLTFESLLPGLREKALFPLDLRIEDLTASSPARESGALIGDIISKIDDRSIYSFNDLRMAVNSDRKLIRLEVIRGGKNVVFDVSPQAMEIDGITRKMIGVQSSGIFLPPSYVNLPGKGIIESFTTSLSRTIDVMERTWSGLYKLVSSEVSFSSMGGPIAIGKIASDSFKMSLTFFLQFMAMVSINLALINLIPIPILDGGHILFIILEFINRGPLSTRKIEIAQQIGLSLLLLLMVSAIYNDVARFF